MREVRKIRKIQKLRKFRKIRKKTRKKIINVMIFEVKEQNGGICATVSVSCAEIVETNTLSAAHIIKAFFMF